MEKAVRNAFALTLATVAAMASNASTPSPCSSAGSGGARVEAHDGVAAHLVQDVAGYNSWPMIQSVGGRLVCAYSRGSAHTVDEGKRGVFARISDDGGRTWGREVCVCNTPEWGEVTVGKGLDANGAMLLWIRRVDRRGWGDGTFHDLWRTADGISWEKISSPELDPHPIQITDVFKAPGGELMSLWFAGSYRAGGSNSWGVVTSVDNGRTWTQRTVERNLRMEDWPTEPSAVNLGGGRILAIGRSEGGRRPQFQLTSSDGGATWKREKTAIADVTASTPSLVFNSAGGIVSNYYYHRGARKMKRRVAKAVDVFGNPLAWSEPEVLAEGFEGRAWDAGNVNAVEMGGGHYLSFYTGTASDASVFVLAVSPPERK